MFDANNTKSQIGTIKVYNTDTSNGLVDTIPISNFVRSDGDSTCAYDLNGNVVIIAGFPTIVTYDPARI